MQPQPLYERDEIVKFTDPKTKENSCFVIDNRTYHGCMGKPEQWYYTGRVMTNTVNQSPVFRFGSLKIPEDQLSSLEEKATKQP